MTPGGLAKRLDRFLNKRKAEVHFYQRVSQSPACCRIATPIMSHDQATPQCLQDEDPKKGSEPLSPEVAQVSLDAEEKGAPTAEAPTDLEGTRKCHSYSATSHDSCSSEEEEGISSSTCQAAAAWKAEPDKSASLLANFMMLKYKMKELISKAEMLEVISNKDEAHFSEILLQASEHLQVLYGLDVKEVDSFHHIYGIFIALGLTYDGIQSDDEASIPKTGVLIVILSTIFMKGNHATEDDIWQAVSVMGFFSKKKHYTFGDPIKLITEDFVKEKYLEWHAVDNSDPVRRELVWGPRAYAETSKMKILQFFAKSVGCVPTDFPEQYADAMLEEVMRGVAGISL
ncbi:melanoma-associated antigen B16-like [Ctenodactylus gundi]